MNNLERLRRANPRMHIFSVRDEEFKPYGRFLDADTREYCCAAEKFVLPNEGSKYIPSLSELETLPESEIFRRTYCGQLDEQLGLCCGHSAKLNALEWHTCSEFNIAVRQLVLLLAKRGDMDADGRLDANRIKAFYLDKGEMIEVYSDTLHFCPCEVSRAGFSCIVGLQRGTNLPLDEGTAREGLLWAKNKWLIAHEDNKSLTDCGAFAGIYGENWAINPIE